MRILMLSWEYPPRIVGGISRVVYNLSQKLGKSGNEVHVITLWEQGKKELEKDENVFVHRAKTIEIETNSFTDWVLQLNFVFIEKAINIINETGSFDIIHAHDWVVAFAACTIKKSYLIPLCATIHATEHGRNLGLHNDTQKYIHDVEWWLSFEAWKIITNSHYMKNEVINLFDLPNDKIEMIYNGINLERFDGSEKYKNSKFKSKYALDHEKIVLFVGRLVQEKGADILIDAVPNVLEQYNDVKFIIVGRGPQFDYLNEKAISMGIKEKVLLTGYIEDDELHNLYMVSDVAVFPSRYEPFGIVALEGMLANIPVVASDTGGLSEIVEHEVDGFKFYAENSNSLADNIIRVFNNPDICEEITVNANNKIKELFNWDKISSKTLDVYKKIIKESKKINWNENNI